MKDIDSHKKSSESQASLDDFYQFFESINENSEEHTDLNSDNADDNFDETSDINVENDVNQPITESEILKNVKLLKNNKASGIDNFVNEHIKSTVYLLLPIYCKLFNVILDTGIIPQSWSIGIIKPI